MISIGPFSTPTVIVFVALILAWLIARQRAKRQSDVPHKEAGALILDAMFWGLLAARLSYISLWWKEYAAAPWSMLAFGDGGFIWWIGLPIALFHLWRKTHRSSTLRRSVLTGVVAGVTFWAAANGLLTTLLRNAAPLPDVQLTTLDERPFSLSAYAGRPVVLNLWASWCPPCRREMPAFEQAQLAFPDLAIVMINQGESAQQAQAFLDSENLNLAHVLLDPHSQMMKAVQSRGLPTTVFFDAQGQQVDIHLGEISLASLKDKIARRFGRAIDHPNDKE